MAAYEDETAIDAELETSGEEMDEDEVQSYVSALLSDAIDYTDSELGEDRAKATKYYRGEIPEQSEEGRSSVVSYDVRDTVHSILPVLMRTFFGSKRVMNFMPRNAEDVPAADQISEYINSIVTESSDSFKTFYACFKDALIRRTGILKYWHESESQVSISKHSGLDESQVQLLAGDADVEGIDVTETDSGFSVEVRRRIETPRVRIECIPPEEFILARMARSIEDAAIVAHRSYRTVSELVSLGYDQDEIEEYAGSEDNFETSPEFTTRHDQSRRTNSQSLEPASKKVLYYEVFAKLDVDGDGYSELRRFCCVSNTYHIVNNEPVDYIPFVLITPDPEPHVAVGASITDIVADIQRIKSAILRNVMDSLSMSIHPRMLVVESQANLEDVLNQEVGSVIRAKNPGAVSQLNLPFVGQQALPILGMLDEIKASRTGISKIALGMDPESLQSSTKVGVDSQIRAAQAHIELLARIIAETGLKPLFRGILKLVVQHQDREQMVRLRNSWIPIDPRGWDASLDISVDIPLGAGSDSERLAFLTALSQKQEQMLQQMGPKNPLVSLQQYYKTLTKMLALAGFKNISEFFSDPSQYQPQPEPPKEPTPEEKYVQVQMKKVEADMISDQAKLELEREKMIRTDDYRRDDMESSLAVRIAEIEAKLNTVINKAQIDADLERDREAARIQQQLLQQQMPS